MASKISINLDTSKENFLVAKCKQNDDLTLEASIFENGLEKDLTNCEIIIQALKADKTYIIQNTDITKLNNKITANLIRDFSRVPGTTKIEIVLVESSKQNTTFSFCLEVVGSVIRGPVESFNTVTILEELEEKIVEAGQVRDETEHLIQSGGAATIGDIQEINSQLEENTQQLSLKPYRSETNWATLNTFDEATRAILLGLQPGQINAVLGVGNVTALNTNFLQELSNNLFVKETVTDNMALSSTGTLVVNTGYWTSDYIDVFEGATYTKSTANRLCFYDSNEVFVSELNPASTFTIPTGVSKVRVSIAKNLTTLDDFKIMLGTTIVEEKSYYKFNKNVKINGAEIDDNSITEKKTDFIEVVENLFNKNTAINGYYVSHLDGLLVASGTKYYSSDYISVKPSTTYNRTGGNRMAFYDENKVFISGIDNTSTYSFTTPSNCAYIRISINTNVDLLDDYVVCEAKYDLNEVKNSKFYNFKYPIYGGNVGYVSNWKGKKWLSYGDSISFQNLWQPFVANKFGLIHEQRGIGGSCISENGKTAYVYNDTRQYTSKKPWLGDAQPANSTEIFESMCNPQRIDFMLNEEVHLITIMGGTNDFGYDVPIGELDGAENTFMGGYSRLLRYLIPKYPNTRIFLLAPTQRKRDVMVNNLGLTTEAYAKATQEIANYFGLPFVNMFGEVGYNGINGDLYTADGNHPNTLGAKRMAEVVIGRLQQFEPID